MPYVDTDEVHIHYEVTGEGPPLILHHGFSDSLLSWTEYGYVAVLREQHQLILIDGRGHGRSDKPYHPDAYGQKQRAGDVVAVLDDLQIEQAHYFGYSLGAWIGFGLARYVPDRIQSLILGGVHPYGQSMGFYRKGLQGGIGGWAEMLRTLADPLPLNVERFLSNDVQALRASVTSDRPDISTLLPTMTMPFLLFVGDADPLHDGVERCSKDLPNAALFSVPERNHIQTILSSDLVLPHVTRFLARTVLTPDRQAA